MQLLPEAKKQSINKSNLTAFDSIQLENAPDFISDAKGLLTGKFWNMPSLTICEDDSCGSHQHLFVLVTTADVAGALDDYEKAMFKKQGYRLKIVGDSVVVKCQSRDGFVNALSTLKQLVEVSEEGFLIPSEVDITDWPSVEHRSISTTFAWYAGYGRIGFDMQLWGLSEWKQFVDICSDFKINQINMVLYGFWPFEFPEYPGVSLKDMPMDIWNSESQNWITVNYSHPNVVREFLPELIAYGHSLGVTFYAYVGLNSFNGGYSSIHRDKRMKLPPDSHFINDFDSLCLSEPETAQYITSSMLKILSLGFDGLDLEESEEAFWYCECDGCQSRFNDGSNTAEEMLHKANTWLLDKVYRDVRDQYPDATIGIRAWRQPPLVRSESLLKEMKDSIPDDVVLFWSPGQYVEESEFEKWIDTFGRERIRARDTEAIGFASGLGRLIRPVKWMGLRTDEEAITQFIEEDIRQHRGSAKNRVAGINGYQFEWYGFFLALFAHSYFGWGSDMDTEQFFKESLDLVFGDIGTDIHHVMRNMFTIHESQLNLFELYFPFTKNKVEARDRTQIHEAKAMVPKLLETLKEIKGKLEKRPHLRHYLPHFTKWEVSILRSEVIYDMALVDLEILEAADEDSKDALLLELDTLNDKSFAIVREHYFDVNPVDKSGIKSCMIPYHEMKRCIHNRLNPDRQDIDPIYLGVESLGWMWL